MNLFSFFVFQQDIIIDRIEYNFAVVEWENESLSVIPLDDFTQVPQEGDIYQFQLKRSPSDRCHLQNNDPIVLQCNERALVVPTHIFWRENSSLSWKLQPIHTKEHLNEQPVSIK